MGDWDLLLSSPRAWRELGDEGDETLEDPSFILFSLGCLLRLFVEDIKYS